MGYIESHDDATLGDILRVLSGSYTYLDRKKQPNRIKNIEKHIKFSPQVMKASKIGAVSLFLTQGPIMLHLGQEWGRSKITPNLEELGISEVTNKGAIGTSSDNLVSGVQTPNSYSADNETNWINYEHIALNQELYDYYQGLIAFRKSQKLLGAAKPEQIEIVHNSNQNALGVIIDESIFGFVNSDPKKKAVFVIADGEYEVFVNGKKASDKAFATMKGGTITIKPAEALILKKK